MTESGNVERGFGGEGRGVCARLCVDGLRVLGGGG